MVCFIFTLTRFNNGEETCPFCGKNFNTLGGHIWRRTAKLTQESLQVVSNHRNDIDSNTYSIEAIDNSIANINSQYELEAPEGILTEYDESLQREKNDGSCYVQCHCGKLCKGIR